MRLTRSLPLLALAMFAGCDSKFSTTTDTDMQRRLETVEDCFPGLFARFEALLDIADTWKMAGSASLPDPVGLTATVGSEAGGTIVTVNYVIDGVTIGMTIRFYSGAGAQQTLSLTGGSLNAIIDEAATALNMLPEPDPFMVGDFSMTGSGIAASGEALTGVIGGSTNGNELQELRTTLTSSTVSGGVPATDPCTITDSGSGCSLTLDIPSLLTDESPTQQYPIGTVTITITGPQDTVNATLPFDGSATIVIVVTDIPGSFTFNVETRVLAYQP